MRAILTTIFLLSGVSGYGAITSASSNKMEVESQLEANVKSMSVLARLELLNSKLKQDLHGVRLRLAKGGSMLGLTLLVPAIGWTKVPEAKTAVNALNAAKRQIKKAKSEVKEGILVLTQINKAGLALLEERRPSIHPILNKFFRHIGAIESDFNSMILILMEKNTTGMEGLYIDQSLGLSFFGELVGRGHRYFTQYRQHKLQVQIFPQE